jgi:hypothetical protein
MGRPLIWLLTIAVVKTAALQGRAILMAGAGTDYLVVVGAMLIAMTLNAGLVAAYAIFVRPREWGVIAGLLAGLTVFEYVVAEGLIYAFGIKP